MAGTFNRCPLEQDNGEDAEGFLSGS